MLSLRDELSARLGEANKRVVEFGKQLQQTTASGSSGMGDLSSMALKVGVAVGIGFSIQKVIAFGKAILDDADLLVKLHDKTNISLQGLQRMRIAGDDASVSLESMTQAVNLMQKRLAGDDKSAVAALEKLGLNLEQIQRMEPDQQFMAIGDAIRGIKDPAEQVNLAMAIFGRGGAEILPVVKRGFDDVKDAAVGMSDTSIKAFDDLGDTIGRWARATKAVIGEAVGVMLQGGELQAGANAFMLSIEKAAEAAEKGRPKFAGMLPPGLPADLDAIMAGFDNDAEAIKRASTEAQKHVDALAAVDLKILEATRDVGHLTTAQETSIIAYDKLGLSIADIALKLDVSTVAVSRFIEEQARAASAMAAHWGKVGSILDQVFGVDTLQKAAQWEDAIDALGGSLASLSNDDLADLRTAMSEALDVMGRTGRLTSDQASRFAVLGAAAASAAIGVQTLAVAEAQLAAVMNQQGIGANFIGLDPYGGSTATATGSPNITAFLGLNQPTPTATAGMFRAAGGPVSSGRPYVVGERGPELFVPSSAGSMYPAGSGGINVSITINGSVLSDKDKIAAAVSEAMMSTLRSQGVRMPAGG